MSALQIIPEPDEAPHPAFDSMWTVAEYASFMRRSVDSVYDSIRKGRLDHLIVRESRSVRISGWKVAAEVGAVVERGGDRRPP